LEFELDFAQDFRKIRFLQKIFGHNLITRLVLRETWDKKISKKQTIDYFLS